MFASFSSTARKCLVSILMIVTISTFTFAPITPTGKINKAEAITATVEGGNGTIQQTISAASNTLIAGFQNAFFLKEFTLDGIAHSIASLTLKSLTRSILNWINSGFQGKPAFVTDLRQLLRDRIDESIGEFIYNDPSLNFLCSPFQLDVKIALAQTYQESAHEGFSEAQCTLSDVTDNVEGFLNGSFSEGGWPAWFELTQNPVNTPTGAYLAAEAEMYARIIDEQGNTIQELDWGNGFLSFKVCSDTDVANGSQKNCDITTPGSVIANQINKSLGAGQDQLISADEINEVISALFAQLAQKVLGGVRNGLLGLGSSSYSDNSFGNSGASSTLDALSEDGALTGQYLLENPFEPAIANEEEHIDLQEQLIAIVNSVEGKIDSERATHGSCFSVSLPSNLINDRDDARLAIASSTQNIATLQTLNTEYENAAKPEDKLPPIEVLQGLQSRRELHNEVDNTLLETRIRYEISEDVNALESRISSAVRRCEQDDD